MTDMFDAIIAGGQDGQIRALETAIGRLRRENVDWKDHAAKLDGTIGRLHEAVQGLQGELERKNEKIRDLAGKYVSAEAERQQYRDALKIAIEAMDRGEVCTTDLRAIANSEEKFAEISREVLRTIDY